MFPISKEKQEEEEEKSEKESDPILMSVVLSSSSSSTSKGVPPLERNPKQTCEVCPMHDDVFVFRILQSRSFTHVYLFKSDKC